MKIGIAFGGFCPLHQGHLDLIMRAKKENDLAVVVVCGYDHDPRGDSCDLPLIKRFRIIHNYLADDVTKVIMLNDSDYGLDESMSPSNWTIWSHGVYDKITEAYGKLPNAEFVWYVSEPPYKNSLDNYSYGKYLGVKEQVVLLDRNENPISGTACRKEPLKNWNKITPPFRAYFSHNILIAGTASEGKTTLVRDIGKYFALPYSYEKGRDICALKTDPEFTIKDFIYNIYEQHKYNEELICSPQNPGVFISDTDNMVTLMYAKAYSEREGFELTPDDYVTLERLANAYDRTDTWNKIFLLAPKPKAIVDDGERYMPDSDYEIRKKFFEHLKSLYDERGYKYEILTGNYYENFCRVRDYIRDLYKGGN